MSAPRRVLDARALRCPRPVLELAKAARDAAPGDLIDIWWTDPAAAHDIPAWARMRGHAVVATAPLPEDAAPLPDDAASARPASVTTVRIGGD